MGPPKDHGFMPKKLDTPKKTRVSRAKKTAATNVAPAHQAHGAQAPTPINMEKAFGIKSVYTAQTIVDYRAQIVKYSVADLHAHAHDVGVLPMDPRDKLLLALERRFLEVQSKSLPIRYIPPTVTPEGQEFIRKFMAGTLR